MNTYDSFSERLRNYLKAVDTEILRVDEPPNEDKGGFLDGLFSETSKDENVENVAYEEFKLLLKTLEDIPLKKMPYAEITRVLYREAKPELLGIIEGVNGDNWRTYENEFFFELGKELDEKVFKLIEHITLSVLQRTHITDELENQVFEVNEQLLTSKKEYQSFEIKIKEYKNEIEDLKSKYNGIVTQFIGILGIFSAVLIGTFGGIQGFTSLFNNAENLPMGKILFVSSIGAASIIFILFFLMHSLSRLIGFNLSSCNCNNQRLFKRKEISKENNTEDIVCSCSPAEKYPLLIYTNFFLFIMALAGVSMMLWRSNESYNDFLHTDLGPFASTCALIFFSLVFIAFLKNALLNVKRKVHSKE
ncbi:hypothetical protein [Alkalicoccobacillus gibsonii]|uniref:hypothetical protein n=1 Tax=Alkalicoccobacillus gibsonii TaxID=79881 RepID=UPI001931CC05|nr:hypothetical protein [Alkalicoccobacillus gibsonii]MBM0064908.1 hypothetical protein [Alkalicoccobacillus gibsonii]